MSHCAQALQCPNVCACGAEVLAQMVARTREVAICGPNGAGNGSVVHREGEESA